VRRFTKLHKGRGKIVWTDAPDVGRKIIKLKSLLELDWLKKDRIFCFRSQNANTRAIARIWGLSRIWQQALNIRPSYVIEVISEKYDRLSEHEKERVLVHELNHIPHNFSGSLMPHTRRGKSSFHRRVSVLLEKYRKSAQRV
jgi:predicted metallopeptidase